MMKCEHKGIDPQADRHVGGASDSEGNEQPAKSVLSLRP